jgi:acyl carrier protein
MDAFVGRAASLARRVAEQLFEGRASASPVSPQPPPSEPKIAAPRSATERAVLELWEEVLGHHRISIHDDFFELGGNSMLVARVVAHLNKTYGVDFSLLTLFEAPTIAELAERIDAVRLRTAEPHGSRS